MDMGYGGGQHVHVNILNIIFYVKHTKKIFVDMSMQIFCPKAVGDAIVSTDIINNEQWCFHIIV